MCEPLSIKEIKANPVPLPMRPAFQGNYVLLASERARMGLIVSPNVLKSMTGNRLKFTLKNKREIHIDDPDGFLDPAWIRNGCIKPQARDDCLFLDFFCITL